MIDFMEMKWNSRFISFLISTFSFLFLNIWSINMKNCLNWNIVSFGFLFYNVCTYFGSPSGCCMLSKCMTSDILVGCKYLNARTWRSFMPSILAAYVSAIQEESKRWLGTLQRQHQMNSAASWSWSLWEKEVCRLCKCTQNWGLWLLQNIKKPYKEVYLLYL